MTAIEEAAEKDTEHKHTREIADQSRKCNEAIYAQRSTETEQETLQRAMQDPEVASIMSDPVMNQILQSSQQNPAALQDHMKNPDIRKKIQKLVAAGVIRTR